VNAPKSRIFDLLNPYLQQNNDTSKKRTSTSLTEREIDVLKLVAFGKTNKEIADELFISFHTVISHRKNITEKLGIKSISGLTVYSILNNLIDTTSIDPESLI
jgi:DNA-binding CsgD family transcriptional regulator